MNRRLTRWVLAALMAYPALILTQGAVQAAAPQPAKTAVVQSRAAGSRAMSARESIRTTASLMLKRKNASNRLRP